MKNDQNNWPELDIAAYGRPCFGERVSGDIAFAITKDEWVFLAIIDGLGHGRAAHEIALLAKDFLIDNWTTDIKNTLEKLHESLKGTGGAAVGLALLNLNDLALQYVGIGNTVVRNFGTSEKRMFSNEGVVGARMRTPTEQQTSIQQSDVIVFYTDGVSENFALREYPQLKRQQAAFVAKTIVRKFGNQFDDATCLVLKFRL
jgi:serine/threonine protein phosphatase PrpC